MPDVKVNKGDVLTLGKDTPLKFLSGTASTFGTYSEERWEVVTSAMYGHVVLAKVSDGFPIIVALYDIRTFVLTLNGQPVGEPEPGPKTVQELVATIIVMRDLCNAIVEDARAKK